MPQYRHAVMHKYLDIVRLVLDEPKIAALDKSRYMYIEIATHKERTHYSHFYLHSYIFCVFVCFYFFFFTRVKK